MKTKTDWSKIILIVSVQFVLMLVAVLMLFSWILSNAEESLTIQTGRDNLSIGRNVAQSVTQSQGENPDLERQINAIVRRTNVPNSGFIAFVDAESNKVIASKSKSLDIAKADFGRATITMEDATTPVQLAAVGKSASANVIFGRSIFDHQKFIVSANFHANSNSVVVVGQPLSLVTANVSQDIVWMRRICYLIALLLGFGCMCLSVSTLNRMSDRVDQENTLLEQEVNNREEELVKTRNAVIFGLAKLAESRDNDTGEHLDRIRSYVMILAEDLSTRISEIDDDFVHTLALASSLHDIGKVGIPDAILLKPGRLTQEERGIMELHTLIGGECLEAIQDRLEDNVFMHFAKQIAYYHHERWDGQGYPHRLSGDKIPLVARIVAVADVYDALTSKRPYKQPLSHLESKAIILSGSGTQFDPEIVNAFLRHEQEFEAISRSQKELSDADVQSEFRTLCERATSFEEDPSFNV